MPPAAATPPPSPSRHPSGSRTENRVLPSDVGEIAFREGLISHDQLEKARKEADATDKPISRVLVDSGAISEGLKMGILEKRLGCVIISLIDVTPRPETFDLLPRPICERHRVVPVRLSDGKLLVAMEDPTDLRALGAVESAAGVPIQPLLAKTAEIMEAIKRLPRVEVAVQGPGLLYRSAKAFALPVVCVVPAVLFVWMMSTMPVVARFFRSFELDNFERILFIVLAWCGWAVIAYWVDALVFKRDAAPPGATR